MDVSNVFMLNSVERDSDSAVTHYIINSLMRNQVSGSAAYDERLDQLW